MSCWLSCFCSCVVVGCCCCWWWCCGGFCWGEGKSEGEREGETGRARTSTHLFSLEKGSLKKGEHARKIVTRRRDERRERERERGPTALLRMHTRYAHGWGRGAYCVLACTCTAADVRECEEKKRKGRRQERSAGSLAHPLPESACARMLTSCPRAVVTWSRALLVLSLSSPPPLPLPLPSPPLPSPPPSIHAATQQLSKPQTQQLRTV